MQTNDLQVLGVMSAKNPRSSAKIANKLGLTPFQITARLASMEKRGLVRRVEKMWLRIVSLDEANTMAEKSKTTIESSRGTIIVSTQDATARRDAKAPVLKHAKGWRFKSFWSSGDNRIQIFTNPKGEHFVYAEPSEQADLLIDYRDRDLGLIRMKRFTETSVIYKRLAKERGRELAALGYLP